MKPAYLLLSVAIPLCVCSCSDMLYYPNAANVPNLKEQYEGHVSGSYFANEYDLDGFDVQTSYSPINRLGLMLDYTSTNCSYYETGYIKWRQIDLGVGYYLPIRSKGIFEVYGGYGNVKHQIHFPNEEHLERRLHKYFLQPAIGFSTDYFDCLFSLRYAYVVSNTDYTKTYLNDNLATLNVAEGTPNFFVLEPALTLRGGSRYLKVQTQLLYSENMTNDVYPQANFGLNLGVLITIAPRWHATRDNRMWQN